MFNTVTGEIAYTLGFRQVAGAYFSDDGALLAMAGPHPDGTGFRVTLVDATTGAVAGDTTITPPSFSIAIDPARPYVYVGVLQENARPEILLLAKDGLRLVRRLKVPASGPACAECSLGIVVLGRNNSLYVAANSEGVAMQAWKFGLAPVQ